MALSNYSAADGLLVINGINITDWGESDPSMTIEDLVDRATFKRGMGGAAAVIDPVALPKKLTINLLTGSSQARTMVALMKSKSTIQAAFTQMGSVESEGLIDGRITSRGPRGRIASSSGALSDEQFVIEFRDSTES